MRKANAAPITRIAHAVVPVDAVADTQPERLNAVNAADTREQWLHRGVDALRERFASIGKPLPTLLYVSVSFPSKLALSKRKRRIGECWTKGGKDGVPHVLISPVLDSGYDALDVLVHELAHVVTPGAGHKGEFIRVGRELGMIGQPTSMGAGDALKADLERLNTALGTYPHSAIDSAQLDRQKQTTRLLKVSCPTCDYTVRIARKWLDIGAPICPLDEIAMEEKA